MIKREKVYNTLINLIEEYYTKLLSTKVYWDDMKEREKFKDFWQKYKNNFIRFLYLLHLLITFCEPCLH